MATETDTTPAAPPDPHAAAALLNDDLRTRLATAIQNKAKEGAGGAAVTAVPDAAKPEGDAKESAKEGDASAKAADAASAAAKPAAKAILPDRDAAGKFIPGQTKAQQWDALKSGYESRIADLQQQLKARDGFVDAKVFGDLKKERDDYAARLQQVAIEHDPKFQREYQTARSVIIDTAKSLVGLEHAEKVSAILDMPPGSARNEAVSDLAEKMPGWQQAQLGNVLLEMDKLNRQRTALVEDRKANWTKLQAEQEAEARQREEATRAILEQQITEWSDPEKGLPLLQKRANDADWNARVDGTVELAREIFGGNLDAAELARAALWAASATLFLEDNAAKAEEIKRLQGELEQFKAAQPGTGGESGAAPAEGDVSGDLSYGSAVAAAIRKEGITFGGGR